MRQPSSFIRLSRQAARIAAATILITALCVGTASAANYSVIYAFPGLPNGWGPTGPMVMDVAGNLYGTTTAGGTVKMYEQFGCGTVFQLSPPSAPGGIWTERLLHSFQNGADGCFPNGGLAMDGDGNLYGTTRNGGQFSLCSSGCGTVFRLTPPATVGGKWVYRSIYSFAGGPNDGSAPDQLLAVGKGVIYGTTKYGPSTSGSYYSGTIFQLKQQDSGFVETTLHQFGIDPNDGSGPMGGLTPDTIGNLFGSTLGGGLYGFGTVYELIPPTNAGGVWTESVLRSFPQILNFFPEPAVGPSRIIIGKNGELFGSTVYEGSTTYCGYGCGTVFKLTPPGRGRRVWSLLTLYNFPNYGDGSDPDALYRDRSTGNFYGTTAVTSGFNSGCGVVFELGPPATASGTLTYNILHSFTGFSDGCAPDGNLIRDSVGNFYGVTGSGGMPNENNGYGFGTVFEITP